MSNHKSSRIREQLDAAYARGVDTPEMFGYVAMYDFTKNRHGPIDDHFASAMPPSPLRPAVSGEVSDGKGVGKAVGLLALLAIPVGFVLAKMQERKHVRTEKAAFRRLGMDWDKRSR